MLMRYVGGPADGAEREVWMPDPSVWGVVQVPRYSNVSTSCRNDGADVIYHVYEVEIAPPGDRAAFIATYTGERV